MKKEECLPPFEEYVKGMFQLMQEGAILRDKYPRLTDFELHQLAATMSSDLIKIVFGWHNAPTVDGDEVEPFRLRKNA